MITPEQRAARQHRIGASDSPIILGLNSHMSPAALYARKVLPLDSDNGGESEVIEIGNTFERPLVEWAGAQLGIEVERDVLLDSHPSGVLSANMDGICWAKKIGIEAKTGNGSDYGEEGTDEVPDRVLVQCLHQCEVGGLDVVYVPTLLAVGNHLKRAMYKVERNETAQAIIVERDLAFWHNHVVPKRPPLDAVCPADIETFRRVKRRPDSWAVIDSRLIEAWEDAKARLKTEKDAVDAAQAAVLLALGDCEGAEFGDPARVFTYLLQERKGYTVEPGAYRVPRIIKRRK